MNAEDEIADLRRLCIQFMQRIEALNGETKQMERRNKALEQEVWRLTNIVNNGPQKPSDQSHPGPLRS